MNLREISKEIHASVVSVESKTKKKYRECCLLSFCKDHELYVSYTFQGDEVVSAFPETAWREVHGVDIREMFHKRNK